MRPLHDLLRGEAEPMLVERKGSYTELVPAAPPAQAVRDCDCDGEERRSEARQQRAATPRVCMCIVWLLMSDLSLHGGKSWFPEIGARKRAGCKRPGLVMQDIDPAEGRWSTFRLPTHSVDIGSAHICDEAEAAESACGARTPAPAPRKTSA